MRYGEFLKDNGRIGFIAPSFGETIEPYKTCFKSAIKVFEDKGYKCVVGENCYKDDGIGKSTDAKSCGNEINNFFINDKSYIIISVGGGETMCEDLEYVDFDSIKKCKPKWFMGYSDNTNLTFLLPTICDTASIYGIHAGNFGITPWHKSVSDTFDLLCGKKLSFENYDRWESTSLKTAENPLMPYNLTNENDIKVLNTNKKEVEFEGRLLGGCLDCLQVLCGTKYDKVSAFNNKYKKDGVIWFIESCELNPMGIFRAMWQLESAGWFNNAKCFLIGRPLKYNETAFGINCEAAYMNIISKYNVPVVYDIDLGHLPPQMPFITGSMAHIKAHEKYLSLTNFLVE